MTSAIPPPLNETIKEVGFDFDWDNEKVWALHLPVEEMDIAELVWHFTIPFLKEHGEDYSLTPQEVMEHPEKYPDEYARTINADLKCPVDIMENKGRWLMLDGLHRLMKASINGQSSVQVRKVSRNLIPQIIKPLAPSRE